MQTHAKVLTLHAKILTDYWACHVTYQLKISSTNLILFYQTEKADSKLIKEAANTKFMEDFFHFIGHVTSSVSYQYST